MTRPVKTLIVLAILAALALSATVSTAAAGKPAGKKPACWKVLINDWYDGTINGKYALHCYRDALKHLGSDTKGYTSAYDDIKRALQQRIAELAAARNHRHSAGGQASAGPGQNGLGGSSSGSGGPRGPVPPPVQSNTAKRGSNSHTPKGKSTSKTPKAGGVAPSPAADKQASPGRKRGSGAIGEAISALGPKDATSMPVPLIVLAGIALLLMAAGTVSLVAKRAQSRRVAMPMRTAPPAHRR